MELDFTPLAKPLSGHSFHSHDEKGESAKGPKQGPATRAKTSLRIRYEAEVQVIKRKLGGLEDIRKTLGLSQRKISQLLFVDPSAWTRWTKAGDEAPPHIYRMLQWYLALEEKYPALDTGFWLSTVARIEDPGKEKVMDNRFCKLENSIERLQFDFHEKSNSIDLMARLQTPPKVRWQILTLAAGALSATFLFGFLAALWLHS